MAGSLMLKYGATAMAYCPILDKKFENYEKDDKAQAMKFFREYCKTRGKTCWIEKYPPLIGWVHTAFVGMGLA